MEIDRPQAGLITLHFSLRAETKKWTQWAFGGESPGKTSKTRQTKAL